MPPGSSAFPSVEVSISVPRLRPLVAEFAPASESRRPQAGADHYRRTSFPSVSGNYSFHTENAVFRNAAVRFGVTRMSAGVSTAVPGRTGQDATPQFEIADGRSVGEDEKGPSAARFPAGNARLERLPGQAVTIPHS